MAHARVELLQRRRELRGAEVHGGRDVRLLGLRILDQVAVEALAVAEMLLEADRMPGKVEEQI